MQSKRNAGVIVIDDESIVTGMLSEWLTSKCGLLVLGTATSGPEGILLCKRHHPDLVLVDVEMPGMDGFAVAKQIIQDLPETRIIILTSHEDPYCIYRASRIGIHGYVDKRSSLKSLEEAISTVRSGSCYFAGAFQSVRDSHLSRADAYFKLLTPREIAVMAMMVVGSSDQQIATQLDISPPTVATHRRNMRSKLGLHDDRGLITYAQRWGIVPLNVSHSPV